MAKFGCYGPNSTAPEVGRVRWVRQEDAEGCALAILAMLTGRSYGEIKDTVNGWSEKGQDWSRSGTSFYTVDRLLVSEGWWMQKRYTLWNLPIEPFAELHYASVRQPSGHHHFVVVLADGIVLDPLQEGERRLTDWPDVNYLVGLAR